MDSAGEREQRRKRLFSNERKKTLEKLEQDRLDSIGNQCQCGCGRKIGDYPRSDFHWDHVDPATKINTISRLRNIGSNIEFFVAELDKCQFLYRECHEAIRHRQIAGEIVDYRFPERQRDWSLLPLEDDDGMNHIGYLSQMEQTIAAEKADGVNINDIGRIMREGGWIVHRDMQGFAWLATRLSDGSRFQWNTIVNRWLPDEEARDSNFVWRKYVMSTLIKNG
jgi:hypothetical protein